jgi:hypothetical protein
MCIYCNTKHYHKIYKNHHSPIPKELNGRSYEIHHIDGNHSNNDPANLIAVTLQEHYDIHKSQGDIGACFLMAKQRKMLSPEDLSALSKQVQKKRIENGSHNFLDKEAAKDRVMKRIQDKSHPFPKREDGTSLAQDRVKAGTHNFLGGAISRAINKKRVDNKSHNLLGSKMVEYQKKTGTHPTQLKISCLGCRDVICAANFLRHVDGKNCKKTFIKSSGI